MTRLIQLGRTITPRWAKPWLRPLYREVRSFARRDLPPVLQISMPKAGTYLGASILNHLGYRQLAHQPFNPDVKMECDAEELRPHLNRIMSGEYVTEHLPWSREIENEIARSGIKLIFIHRDPRSVCLSFAHFADRPEHHFYDYYHSLPTIREKVMATLDGVPDEKSRTGHGRAPLGVIFDRFHPWLNSPIVHSASFEELIGPAGGGSAEKQLIAVAGLVKFLGLKADAGRVQDLADRAFDRRSVTFRSGQSDAWRCELDPETVKILNHRLSPQLQAWGYQQ